MFALQKLYYCRTEIIIHVFRKTGLHMSWLRACVQMGYEKAEEE